MQSGDNGQFAQMTNFNARRAVSHLHAVFTAMRMTMFGPLRVFLSHLAQCLRPLDGFEQKNCRLPTAALLIRVARVENEMSEARQKKLHVALKSRFQLDDCSTNQLISDAVAAERNAIISTISLVSSMPLSTTRGAEESLK